MTLGSMIATARKAAECSVEELAAATNLRPTLIREIEMNDFSHCGGDAYARGHIRNIAKRLNADEKEFLRIFDEEHGGVKRSMHELLVENNIMRKPEIMHKISWKVLLVISIASIGIVGSAHILISNISSVKNEAVKVVAAPTLSASPVPSNPSVVSTGTGVVVIVKATRAKSWIFVSDASGRALFSDQIAQGDSRTFTTHTRLDLKIGNAGGVDLEVNGKKLSSIGGNGAVVSLSYGVNS